ncbi:unnamed protein product [Protopolystoma xenopodis]|uniref:TOG domain-containing protein n=1 Tax=Protopolystoma xenopodis TaxID=117903 RepID=A0A3S5A0I8_9PLAT|nr:unnamed protein product [Protopolystoma xenopodis]
MTQCAPKQLSACLPQIVPRLLTVLLESQPQLRQAGGKALTQIGGVIRNPEVQALVPRLITCLQDPLANKTSCLLALRDTCFVHVIDAPSLALIMPVVQRAFDDRSTETRKMAAQIFGNLYSLAKKEDLQPYVGSVMPGLKTCLLDPVPEVRSVAARALGAMVRGMGESCFKVSFFPIASMASFCASELFTIIFTLIPNSLLRTHFLDSSKDKKLTPSLDHRFIAPYQIICNCLCSNENSCIKKNKITIHHHLSNSLSAS